MPGKHRVWFVENRARFHRSTRLAADYFPHENEGRPMGEAKKVTSDE
jgi:hypothetical protein